MLNTCSLGYINIAVTVPMLMHTISFSQFNSILSTYSKCTINLLQAGVTFAVGCKEC